MQEHLRFAADHQVKPFLPHTLVFTFAGAGPKMLRSHLLTRASSTFELLFEASLLGDVPMIECIRASSHPVAGMLLSYVFMILTILLLLNMIVRRPNQPAKLDFQSRRCASNKPFAAHEMRPLSSADTCFLRLFRSR